MNPSSSGTKTLTSITESYYYGRSSDSYYSPHYSLSMQQKSRNRKSNSKNKQLGKLENKKYDLEVKIEVLKRRLAKLKKEKKKNLRKKFPKKIISQIDEQPRQIDLTPQINDVIKSYIRIKQEVTSLDSECAVLEIQIHNEKEKREIMLDEFDDIDNTFRFTDYCPQIELNQFRSFQDIQTEDPFVYRRRIELLRSLNKQINDIDCQRKSTDSQSQAALEFARSSFAEVKLKSIGKSTVKLEIDSLEHILKNTSLEVMKRENEKENLRHKQLRYELDNKNEITKSQQRAKTFQEAYDKELNDLDNDIFKLSSQIDKRAREFDIICRDIENLDYNTDNVYDFSTNDQKNDELISEYNFAGDENDDDDDDIQLENNIINDDAPNFDFSDNVKNSKVNFYIQQRDQLLNEIENLKSELEEKKIKAKERKEKLKNEICDLYNSYNQKKKELRNEMSGTDDCFSSGISSAFLDLANSIELSISDLRQIQQSP